MQRGQFYDIGMHVNHTNGKSCMNLFYLQNKSKLAKMAPGAIYEGHVAGPVNSTTDVVVVGAGPSGLMLA